MKFQLEITSNKKIIAKTPLTNLYEMNSSSGCTCRWKKMLIWVMKRNAFVINIKKYFFPVSKSFRHVNRGIEITLDQNETLSYSASHSVPLFVIVVTCLTNRWWRSLRLKSEVAHAHNLAGREVINVIKWQWIFGSGGLIRQCPIIFVLKFLYRIYRNIKGKSWFISMNNKASWG